MNVDRIMWGAIVGPVALALLALLAIYLSMPSPHRAMTPPLLNPDSHIHTCYRYRTQVRVQIETPPSDTHQGSRRRRARRVTWPSRHRAHPTPDASHAAGGAEEGNGSRVRGRIKHRRGDPREGPWGARPPRTLSAQSPYARRLPSFRRCRRVRSDGRGVAFGVALEVAQRVASGGAIAVA